MILSDDSVVLAENWTLVPTLDSNSLVNPTINEKDFFSFTGDITETVSLEIATSNSALDDIKGLFGSWVESGEEDKHIEELYKHRNVPSSLADE